MSHNILWSCSLRILHLCLLSCLSSTILAQNDTILAQNDYDTYYDPNYDYAEPDECKGGQRGEFIDGMGQNSIHSIFHDSNLTPIRNIQEWKNAKMCCDDHSYIFQDLCKARIGSYMEHVCSVLQHDTVPPKKYTQSLVCPEGCKMYRMADHANKEKNSTLKMFNLGQDGRTLSIDSNSTYSKYAMVKDYCLGYVWTESENNFTLSLDVCLCFDENLKQQSEANVFTNELHHRCCKESEIIGMKQKISTSMTGSTFTVRCGPNLLNQTSYAQPGGLSEEYKSIILKSGETRLYRDTAFTCHHSKKWQEVSIAQPHAESRTWTAIPAVGHLSDNGANLMVKFNPLFIEQGVIAKNLDMPLTSFDHYCVGSKIRKSGFHPAGPFQPILMYCDTEANRGAVMAWKGRNITIRIGLHCGLDKMWMKEERKNQSACSPIDEAIRNQLLNNYNFFTKNLDTLPDESLSTIDEDPKFDGRRIFRSSLFDKIPSEAFYKYPLNSKLCPRGEKDIDKLRPDTICNDRFYIDFDENDNITKLIVSKSGKKYNHYTIYANNDGSYWADVCRAENSNELKKDFIKAFLIISCLLLATTFVIYAMYSKNLFNFYTKIMMHYCACLFLAFFFLTVNKFHHLGASIHKVFCEFTGFLLQYLFVCSFTFMSTMAIETWMQLKGSPSNSKRYKILVGCSYGLPLIVSLLTIIVEFAAPRCASYRPRFGEESCFFSEKTSKGIWFFLPMGIALLINGSIFASIMYTLYKIYGNMQQFQLKKKDGDTADKVILYLKMFMGMGFFWTLEIVAGLSSDDTHDSAAWYIFDGINTLQGLWVFVIFVCKDNVTSLLLVTAGLRESKRSKTQSRAKSRANSMQMKRKTKSGASPGKWTVDNSSVMSDDGATVVSTVG